MQIEKDMIYISKTDLWDRLSKEEQNFAKRQVPWPPYQFNLLVFVFYFVNFVHGYRCYENMKGYLDESVLSKLPSGYQSDLKQSNASEEDDMGTALYSSYGEIIYSVITVCEKS